MARVKELEGDVKGFANAMLSDLDEGQRRRFLARFSDYLGRGGATKLAEFTGVSQQTISAGRKELRSVGDDVVAAPAATSKKRIRAEGGGRKLHRKESRCHHRP